MLEAVLAIVALGLLAGVVAFSLGWFRNVSLSRRLAIISFPLAQLAMATFLFMVAFRAELGTVVVTMIALVCVGCAGADVALFEAIRRLRRRAFDEARALLLEKRLQTEQAYRAELDAEASTARALRSSIQNELTAIERKLDAGNVDGAMARIDAAASLLRPPANRQCAHRVVDALMRAKAAECESKGIVLTSHLDVPQDLPFPEMDLCSLFANVMDNAIKACSLCGSERRHVGIRAGKASGLFVIDAENGCPLRAGREERHARRAKGLDEHGWGLAILRDVPYYGHAGVAARRCRDAMIDVAPFAWASRPSAVACEVEQN